MVRSHAAVACGTLRRDHQGGRVSNRNMQPNGRGTHLGVAVRVTVGLLLELLPLPALLFLLLKLPFDLARDVCSLR